MELTKAKELINGLIQDADAVRHDQSKFDAWRLKCETVLDRIFGPGSKQLKGLQSVNFKYYGVSQLGDNTPHIRAFNQGLDKSQQVLESLIWEIEQFGPPGPMADNPADAKQLPTREATANASGFPDHVVLLVHGIESEGAWMQQVQSALESDSIRVVPIKFDRFPIARFLSPFDMSRDPIARVDSVYRAMVDAFPRAKVSAIAHSFGTHVLTKMLSEQATIRLWRIVLCGSVIKTDLNWRAIAPQIGEGADKAQFIVNDCGNKDYWPVLGRSLGFWYGNAGTYGVGGGLVTDRFHEGGHGLFFDERFINQYWKPFIVDGQIVPGTARQGQGIPFWVKVLGYSPWIAKALAGIILALIVFVVWFLLDFFFLAPTYNLTTLETYHRQAMRAKDAGPADIRQLDVDYKNHLVHWTGTVVGVDPSNNAYKVVGSEDAKGPAKIWASFADRNDYNASFIVGDQKEFTGVVQEVNDLGTIVHKCRSGNRTSWWSRFWYW